MSDNCRLKITFLKTDMARFEAVLGKEFWSTVEEEDDLVMDVVIYEADRGWFEIRPKLAAAGFTFEGSHDAGHEYGAYAFACFEGRHVEVPIDHDGCPFARVYEDDKVVESDIDEARRFYAIREAAGKRFWPKKAVAGPSQTERKE